MIVCTIECELTEIAPIQKWFEREQLIPGAITLTAIKGATLELTNVEDGVGFVDSHAVSMVLTFSSAVASKVIASAIYDGLKEYVRHLKMNGLTIRNEPDAIGAEVSRAAAQQATSSERDKSEIVETIRSEESKSA